MDANAVSTLIAAVVGGVLGYVAARAANSRDWRRKFGAEIVSKMYLASSDLMRLRHSMALDRRSEMEAVRVWTAELHGLVIAARIAFGRGSVEVALLRFADVYGKASTGARSETEVKDALVVAQTAIVHALDDKETWRRFVSRVEAGPQL